MGHQFSVKPSFLLLAFVIAFSALTQAAGVSHHHKTAVGIHGMAIFTGGDRLYASHMPLANSIHAHQVIFSFGVEPHVKSELTQMLTNNTLVSLMPERFDLMHLMSGKLNSFNGTLFTGHFERGGEVAIEDVKVKVERIILNADLMTDANDNGQFYLVATGKEQGILVHRIASAPSFDQIVQVQIVAKPDSKTSTVVLPITKGKPIELAQPKMVNTQGYSLKLTTPLYLETKDFQ